ncbi:hypothetical protein EMPS_10723 [Entomortierella parvispora]|uniref:non-specific serine/threonine protein kinase n=1 Tax=Entomortierella parvispora TaxID=205924 RepID=A0A9P3HKB7_9FUNG|nr:hypothetical protein EMPS_10723 [Entomortierella parvispora]
MFSSHISDDTSTVSSPQTSTELGSEEKAPMSISSAIISGLSIITDGQVDVEDPLRSPLTFALQSPIASLHEEGITQFDRLRKKNKEKLERFDQYMTERIEKARESFRHDRAEKKTKLIEDYDRETPVLEQEMIKRLQDDLQTEYEKLNSPRSLFTPGVEHMSDVKRVTERKARRVGEYVILKFLGKGNSAHVYERASCLKSDHFAIRVIVVEEGKGHWEKINEEVAVMKKLSHPNIIQLYEVLRTQVEYYMVLELCKGELLKDEQTGEPRKQFDEAECRDIFQQLILGMEYLHEHKVIHRDIKPRNLLISSEGKLKIADFGISLMFATGQTTTIKSGRGTAGFMAPEIFESFYAADDKGYNGNRADI